MPPGAGPRAASVGAVSVPDPLGRDRLATGAAMYRPPVHGQKRAARRLSPQRRLVAAALAAGVLGSLLLYQSLRKADDTPAAAATTVIQLLLDEQYGRLRSALCREDRSKVGTNDLEQAGRSASSLLRTLDEPRVTSLSDVVLKGARAGLEAKQVTGEISSLAGPGTQFRVVTVREAGGWRVCLSPGGYALGALNLDVPIGDDLEVAG